MKEYDGRYKGMENKKGCANKNSREQDLKG